MNMLEFAPIQGVMTLTDQQEILLSTSEAAAYLKVTTGYIRRLVREQRLPSIRVNTFHIFRKSDLDAWLAKPPKQGRPRKG